MTSIADLFSSRLALKWLAVGEWRAHPARLCATALAIAVGVALGFAVHLVNGSALAAFDGTIRAVGGDADLQVSATSKLGFDENIYPKVALATGVADASPVVKLDAHVNGRPVVLLGLDVTRTAVVTPALVGFAGSGQNQSAVFDADTVFLSRAAMSSVHTRVGAHILVSANGRTQTLMVGGRLPAVADEDAVAVMDIAAAQWRFDRLGKLDRIDLKLDDRATAIEAVRRILPSNATMASVQSQITQDGALSRAYRVNLDMLALVALVTGGFLVFSAQSLSVSRRMRLFALVRTLGLSRHGIVAAVAIEGVAIGVIGASTGLVVGYGMASAALRVFGGDLGAGYFKGDAVHVAFQPRAAILFFLLGLMAALLGSILPARTAAKAAPAVALKNSGDILDPRAPVAWIPAAALLALGGLTAFLPPVANLPIFGFIAMALLLAGGVAGVPWLARTLLSQCGVRRMDRLSRFLAIRHVHGAPGEAATALCGIVASTALMISMATMVASFRGAVDEWLGQILAADLYVRIEGEAGFSPHLQRQLASTPGLSSMSFSKQLPLTIASDRPPIILIARDIASDASPVLIQSGTPPPGLIPVWISEPASNIYHWRSGDTILLPLGSGQRVAVAGIWRDYARQQGALIIRQTDYSRLTHDQVRTDGAAMLRAGANIGLVSRALMQRIPPDLKQSVSIASPSQLRHYALRLFDQSFAVTYVLEAVAILVGLAGVATTISAQTIARIHEFGMLRHLGVDRGQITMMLGIEGGVLGCIGGLAGTALGALLSQVLIHVINPQSFHWTMTTRFPGTMIVAVVLTLIFSAALTAMVCGRRATSRAAILAVREDW